METEIDFMTDAELEAMFPDAALAARVKLVRDELARRYHAWLRTRPIPPSQAAMPEALSFRSADNAT